MYYEPQDGTTISHFSFTSTIPTLMTKRSTMIVVKPSSPLGLIVSTSYDFEDIDGKNKGLLKAKVILESLKGKGALRLLEAKEFFMKMFSSKLLTQIRTGPQKILKKTKGCQMKKYYRKKNKLDGEKIMSEREYMIEVDDKIKNIDQFGRRPKEAYKKMISSKLVTQIRTIPRRILKKTKRSVMKKYYRKKNKLDGEKFRSERGYLIEVDDDAQNILTETERHGMKKYYSRKHKLDGVKLRSERGYPIEVDDESNSMDQFYQDAAYDTSSTTTESIEQQVDPNLELDANSLVEQ
jgi:hypothetical protein